MTGNGNAHRVTHEDVWFTRCPVPTAFGLSVASGELSTALADIGVYFRSLATTTDPAVRGAHFAQTQPRGLRHGGNIPPLVAASRGVPVTVIGLSIAPSNSGLLALPSSGISSVADLRGRTIGIPRRTGDPIDFWRASALQAVDRALEAAELDWTDIRIREIPVERSFLDGATSRNGAADNLWDATFMFGFQREETAALVTGDVDLIFSEGANSVITQALTGSTVVYDAGARGQDTVRSSNLRPLTLTVDTELLETEPDVVDVIVRTVLDTARRSAHDRDSTLRAIAAEVGLPEELVDSAFSPTLAGELDIDLSTDRVQALEEQLSLLVRHGFIENPPDLAKHIDSAPLERAHAQLSAEKSI